MNEIKKGDKVIYSGKPTFKGIVTESNGKIASVFTKGQTYTVPTSMLTKQENEVTA